MAPPITEQDPNQLSLRLISVAVLVPPTLCAVYAGSPYFDALICVGAATLVWEVIRVCKAKPVWMVAAIGYTAVSLASLWLLRSTGDQGQEVVLWLFAVVWAADSGAYFCGRTIGGPKLAPKISPQKTWAGFFGALAASALVGFAAAVLVEKSSYFTLVALTIVTGGISQLGDLLESWVKRQFSVKDTSQLVPGHGGLFDRVDGLLMASLATWAFDTSIEGSILEWL
jgi:phosphatidate cytidylyltransferase